MNVEVSPIVARKIQKIKNQNYRQMDTDNYVLFLILCDLNKKHELQCMHSV